MDKKGSERAWWTRRAVRKKCQDGVRRGRDTLITKGKGRREKQIGTLFTFPTLFASWER